MRVWQEGSESVVLGRAVAGLEGEGNEEDDKLTPVIRILEELGRSLELSEGRPECRGESALSRYVKSGSSLDSRRVATRVRKTTFTFVLAYTFTSGIRIAHDS